MWWHKIGSDTHVVQYTRTVQIQTGVRTMKLRIFAACGLSIAASLTAASTVMGARHHPVRGGSLVLLGAIRGTETHIMSNPDVGASYKWEGPGTVKPLGAVTATGSNHGVGFIAQGVPTGVMTLSTTAGSITLKVTYDRTPGFAPLPRHGTYAITGGTGSYAKATGTGSLVRDPGTCSNGTAQGPAGSCPIGTPFPVTYTLKGDASKKKSGQFLDVFQSSIRNGAKRP
jgi:hypothetical protein